MIALILQYFGVQKKAKRLSDAASEMHLMQDGEEILGAYCWKETENIEDLSEAYWNLRRLQKEQANAQSKIAAAEETLASAQSARVNFLDRSQGAGKELQEQRTELAEQIEEVSRGRDELMANANRTKKKHSALMMKIKVLQEEEGDNEAEIKNAKDQLTELRGTFEIIKQKVEETTKQSNQLAAWLEIIQSKLDAEASDTKGESAESFSQIGKANRDITKYRAEMGTIRSQQADLFREIGRYLKLNSKNPECRAACKKHRGIHQQVNLLHRSITLNHKLAHRLGG